MMGLVDSCGTFIVDLPGNFIKLGSFKASTLYGNHGIFYQSCFSDTFKDGLNDKEDVLIHDWTVWEKNPIKSFLPTLSLSPCQKPLSKDNYSSFINTIGIP